MEGGKEITAFPWSLANHYHSLAFRACLLSETIGATPIDETCSKYISHIVCMLAQIIDQKRIK